MYQSKYEKQGRKRTAVERLAEKAGGINALAGFCCVGETALRHWNAPSVGRPGGRALGRDGSIPDRYHARLLAAFANAGIAIDAGELVNV